MLLRKGRESYAAFNGSIIHGNDANSNLVPGWRNDPAEDNNSDNARSAVSRLEEEQHRHGAMSLPTEPDKQIATTYVPPLTRQRASTQRRPHEESKTKRDGVKPSSPKRARRMR